MRLCFWVFNVYGYILTVDFQMSELKFVSFRQSRTRQKSKNHFKAVMESFSWNSSRLSEKGRNSLIFSSAQNWQGARCLNLNSLFNSRVWTETLPTGLHCCRTSFKWQSTLTCMIQHSLLIVRPSLPRSPFQCIASLTVCSHKRLLNAVVKTCCTEACFLFFSTFCASLHL